MLQEPIFASMAVGQPGNQSCGQEYKLEIIDEDNVCKHLTLQVFLLPFIG